jgi:hypothetical protein
MRTYFLSLWPFFCLPWLLAFAGQARTPLRTAPTAAQLEQAIWIDGQVELPAGTPADERISVVARGEGKLDFSEHRVQLGDDGRFRVALARDALRGWITLEARYASLPVPLAWHDGMARNAHVLKPELGGALRGRLVVPESARDKTPSWEGTRVVLTGTPLESSKAAFETVALLDARGEFESGGLPAGYEIELVLAVAPFVPLVRSNVRIEPGRVQALELALELGASVRGTVVDERSRPLAGALIGAHSDALFAALVDLPGTERPTGADGTFEISGIPSGKLRLWATLEGYLPKELELEALRAGEVRAGVQLVLESGNVLAGRVLHEDGRPAAGCELHATLHGNPPSTRSLRTAVDGTFRLTGLTGESVDLEATLRAPGATPTARERVWSARAAGVSPRTSDLVLTLSELYTLAGRVQDDLGRNVLRFEITAVPAGDEPLAQRYERRITLPIESDVGVFELAGLKRGAWYVYATAKALTYEPGTLVRLPEELRPVPIVLRRTASLSGVALDAEQKPLAGAIVEVRWEREPILPGGATSEVVNVITGPTGKYQIVSVRPGRVTLGVRTQDGRAGPTRELEIAAGEDRSGVDVALGR